MTQIAARRSRSGDWSDTIYDLVRAVPPGRVATYGLVAMLAGRPRAARAVGHALRVCDDPSVPCHRVVNSAGRLAPGFLTQRARLRREGVAFVGQHVDLARHLWMPRLPRGGPPARSYRSRAVRTSLA